MINDFINPSRFSQNKTCILKDVLCPNYVLNTFILGIDIFYIPTEKIAREFNFFNSVVTRTGVLRYFDLKGTRNDKSPTFAKHNLIT